MLHYQRKKQEEFARREAAGEDLWTPSFSDEVITRITEAWKILGKLGNPNYFAASALAETNVTLATGRSWKGLRVSAEERFAELLRREPALVPSFFEAYLYASNEHTLFTNMVDGLNKILAEERVKWEYVEGQMIDFESKETHEAIVAPTLRLLSGRSGWDKVEAAYQDALRQIGVDPSNAITDAGTALQEALTLLGCDGNALGPLAKSAKKKGLLAPHDEALSDAICKIIEWTSADRSEKGDGHKASAATRDDAWLAVHIVGSLILRLAGDSRGRP